METPNNSEALHARVTALETAVRQLAEQTTRASMLSATRQNFKPSLKPSPPRYRIVESRQGRLFSVERCEDGAWKTVIRRTTHHAALTTLDSLCLNPENRS